MKTLTAATLFCTLLLSNEALAQSWWERAKSILGSDTGKQITETIINQTASSTDLTNGEISNGLREALRLGTEHVVDQLGTNDGFNLDPKIHIPLPNTLARVDAALSTIGMNSLTNELELRLNRAAELATPKAKALFINAISQMTIDDAKNILTGPQDAATKYLRSTMGQSLSTEIQPIIKTALASAGAIKAYDSVMGQYSEIPFMPDVKANLNAYVTERAMDGIFYYVAKEEAAIRTDPAARTTDLLKKVFSSN